MCSDVLPSGGGFFDVAAFYAPVAAAAAVSLECAGTTTYRTESSRYCSLDNVDVFHHASAAVVENSCARKCGTRTTDAVRTPSSVHAAAGELDFCSGNDLVLSHPDASEFALCLPREQCEALCTSLAECESIDMHRQLPRCYLNTKCSREILAEMGKSFADCELDKQAWGGATICSRSERWSRQHIGTCL
jgi:hypothetical protein